MATPWLRRGWLLAACAASLLLAACGSGSIDSQLKPTRIVAFGDGFADAGQTGAKYTVNDSSVNNWPQFVATSFLLPLTPSASGGLNYAWGNARVAAKPDAAGGTATLTVQEQVDAFLASNAFTSGDLVLVGAGVSDVVAEAQAAITGAQTRTQMLANLGQAGRDLGAQVRRLVKAGATHVLVTGTYNLGRSPWAVDTKQEALLLEASTIFNDQFLVSVVDLGANVLYVDAALQLNLVTASPATYSLTNSVAAVCTSMDAGAGIGTGAGQVNARLCTPNTVLSGADYNYYLFADRVYLTPTGHRLLGDYAYARLRQRW